MRLLILVEGPTEEEFVKEFLAPHLGRHGYSTVSPRLMGRPRERSRRGGVPGWSQARRDILRHLKEDPGVIVSTMVDYYGLPQGKGRAWPGREVAEGVDFANKANTVEEALSKDVRNGMGKHFIPKRFLPYVMMHEFEAMLFSDCDKFARGIERPELAAKFREIRSEFGSPEEINDSEQTAPSKRIQRLVPKYDKLHMGGLAVLEIGLEAICAECLHFRSWVERLKRLAGDAE